MFYSSKWRKLSVLCSGLLCVGTLMLASCNSSLPEEVSDQSEVSNQTKVEISENKGTADKFVVTCLKDLVKGFDYDLYEDSACTAKALYSTASYFLALGNDNYYFSNVSSYDSENKTLYVEVVKNAQKNKDGDAFIFTSENKSYLTTLKISGVAKIITGGQIEIYENDFNSVDFKPAWNNKSENYKKIGTVYYKEKKDFTTLKVLPAISDKTLYLLDDKGEYVQTYEKKAYSVKFGEYNIERPNMSQNLYQITSDDDYWYFGFSETSKDSYNKGLLNNYLDTPAICRVHFSSDLKTVYISDSHYLSQAKPEFEDQDWKESVYTFTEDEPPASGSDVPSGDVTDLEALKALAASLTRDSYWKNVANPDESSNNYRFWFGVNKDGKSAIETIYYVRMKGMVAMKNGAGIYLNNKASKPADDLYTDEIYSDGTSIAVYGHLATSKGNEKPQGAVYPPNDDDIGKYAVWVVTTDGVKISQLFDTLEACKTGPHTFTEYSWQ